MTVFLSSQAKLAVSACENICLASPPGTLYGYNRAKRQRFHMTDERRSEVLMIQRINRCLLSIHLGQSPHALVHISPLATLYCILWSRADSPLG